LRDCKAIIIHLDTSSFSIVVYGIMRKKDYFFDPKKVFFNVNCRGPR